MRTPGEGAHARSLYSGGPMDSTDWVYDRSSPQISRFVILTCSSESISILIQISPLPVKTDYLSLGLKVDF